MEKTQKVLTMDLMTTVLESAPVAVYVSAMDTKELLYANQTARKFFLKKQETEGITCYEAAGFDKPCPFCRASEMSFDALYTREFHHPANQRIYQLSGKRIDWAGRPAHIEYIVDITEKRRKEDQEKALTEELQKIFSSIPCGLCVYRFRGGQITPLFHNPAFYSIMGYSGEHIEALEQRTDFLGVHPEDMGLLKEKIWRGVEKGEIIHHTYRVWMIKGSSIAGFAWKEQWSHRRMVPSFYMGFTGMSAGR